jgi:hypothetical protein
VWVDYAAPGAHRKEIPRAMSKNFAGGSLDIRRAGRYCATHLRAYVGNRSSS